MAQKRSFENKAMKNLTYQLTKVVFIIYVLILLVVNSPAETVTSQHPTWIFNAKSSTLRVKHRRVSFFFTNVTDNRTVKSFTPGLIRFNDSALEVLERGKLVEVAIRPGVTFMMSESEFEDLRTGAWNGNGLFTVLAVEFKDGTLWNLENENCKAWHC